MKRKIAYADRRELNDEPIGTPGVPVDLDFLPTPAQVRRTLKTVKVTVDLEPASVVYYRREARRRGETPAEMIAPRRDHDGSVPMARSIAPEGVIKSG